MRLKLIHQLEILATRNGIFNSMSFSKARVLSITAMRRNTENDCDNKGGTSDERVKALKELNQRLSQNKNKFEFFNIKEGFKLEEVKLQREMRRLQSLMHPDRFALHSFDVIRQSEFVSSHVNIYYQTLRDPYLRARHLLCLKRGVSDSDLDTEIQNYKTDQKFMERVLELNEKIESSSDDPRSLKLIELNLDNEINKLMDEIQVNFEAGHYDDVMKGLISLKYLTTCKKAASKNSEWSNNQT